MLGTADVLAPVVDQRVLDRALAQLEPSDGHAEVGVDLVVEPDEAGTAPGEQRARAVEVAGARLDLDDLVGHARHPGLR